MSDETKESAYVGHAQGGPLDGKLVESRFPKGLLLVDKQAGVAYLYDWNGQAFLVREPEGRALVDDYRWEAADSAEWDVRAFVLGEEEAK